MCKKTSQIEDLNEWNWVSTLFVVIALLFVACSLILPSILTTRSSGIVFDAESGQIGDTIGGIMNPFVGLASVAMMFLAFYMQYKANQLQRKLFNKQIQEEKVQFNTELTEQKKQFERDRFENQFFQMLQTHKENSNAIINRYHEGCELGSGFGGNMEDYHRFVEQRKKGFEYLVEKINKEYNHKKKAYKEKSKKRIYKEDRGRLFGSVYDSVWEDSFGHYFRHLFLMVKFVVSKSEDFLTPEKKRDYLRILRASLSISEQIFLYYNWLSGYGEKWENEKNQFLTTYRMIHNVNPKAIHKDFEIKKISPFKELLERDNYDKESEDDDLFELIT